MKTTLYYFSGTGNSLAVTRQLVSRIPGAHCVSISMLVSSGKKIKAKTQNVGFVFPLYHMGAPEIVLKFLDMIDLTKSRYLFAVVTKSTNHAGGAIRQVSKVIRNKGSRLNAGFYVVTIDNFIPGSSLPDREAVVTRLQKAAQKIEKIASCISKSKGKIEHGFAEPIGPWFSRQFLDQVKLPEINHDRKFHVQQSCNGCATCVKICPVANIVLVGKTPHWSHQCQLCLACLHFCPQKAIEYGETTQGKPRYHHPDVTVNDFIGVVR